MALYVRSLRLIDHDVEVTVTRHGAGYMAVLRVYIAGQDSALLHRLQVESASADGSDRAAQNQARAWLEARQFRGDPRLDPARPSR